MGILDKSAQYMHNLAEPLGDVIADGALEAGVGVLNGGIDLVQIGGTLVGDLGQAGVTTYNNAKQGQSGAVDPQLLDAEQMKHNAKQQQVNDTINGWQAELDGATSDVVRKTQ